MKKSITANNYRMDLTVKKYIAVLTTILISGTTMAQTGLTVGVGYQTSEIANSDGRNGDPAGLSINLRYTIPGVDGFSFELDIMDHEDEANLGSIDTIATSQDRTGLKIGYEFTLDDSTSLSAAIYNADIQWEWQEGRPTSFNRFESDDSGVSLVIGADKDLGNGVSLGTALSLGFETGVEAYTSIKLTDNLDVKMSFFKSSYELEFEEFDELGPTGDGTAFGDRDFQFDTSGFRVSLNYSF